MRGQLTPEQALELFSRGVEGVREWNEARRKFRAAPTNEREDLAAELRLGNVASKGSPSDPRLRARLSLTDLSGLAFPARADLSEADLGEVNLSNATLERTVLRRARLACSNLSHANLRRADLREADLERADLHEAQLEGADLRGANLRAVDLGRANLTSVRLAGADLRDAVLLQATWKRANFDGAKLDGAQFLSRAEDEAAALPDLAPIVVAPELIAIFPEALETPATTIARLAAISEQDSRHRNLARRELVRSRQAAFVLSARRAQSLPLGVCFSMLVEMGPSVYRSLLTGTELSEEEALELARVLCCHEPAIYEAAACLRHCLKFEGSSVASLVDELHQGFNIYFPERLPELQGFEDRLLAELRDPKVASSAASALLRLHSTDVRVLPALLDRSDLLLAAGDPGAAGALLVGIIDAFGAATAEAVLRFERIIASELAPSALKAILDSLFRLVAPAEPLLTVLNEARERIGSAALADWLKRARRRGAGGAPRTSLHGELATFVAKFNQQHLSNTISVARDSPARLAHRDAERSTRSDWVPLLALAFQKKLRPEEFYALAHLLGGIVKNTRDPQGIALLGKLLQREKLKLGEKELLLAIALKSEARELAPSVRRFLHEKNWGLVNKALECIQVFQDEEAVNEIADTSERHPGHWVPQALGRIGGPVAVAALLQIVKRPMPSKRQRHVETRHSAIVALGTLRATAAVPDLIELLGDREYQAFRAGLLWVFAQTGDPRAFEPVLATATEALENEEFETLQTLGSDSTFYNALDLFVKLEKAHDVRVRAFVEQLRFPPNWARLFREERRLLNRFFPSGLPPGRASA